MNTPSPHRVRTVSLHIHVGQASEALRVRKHLRETWDGLLLEQLQRAFDKIDVVNQVIRIPKLEVRLRVMGNSEWEKNLPRLLYENLTEQWSTEQAQGPSSSSNTAYTVIVSEAENRHAELVHYLRTGSLLWVAESLAGVKNRMELVARGNVIDLVSGLGAETDPASVLFRLLDLLDEPHLTACITSILKLYGEMTQHSDVIAEINNLFRSAIDLNRYHGQRFTAEFLATMWPHRNNPNLLLSWFQSHTFREERHEQMWAQQLWQTLTPLNLTEPKPLGRCPDAPFRDPAANTLPSSPTTQPELSVEPTAQKYLPVAPSGFHLTIPIPTSPSEPALDMRTAATPKNAPLPFLLPVFNVGVVLLHPFLPRFFQTCGLHLSPSSPPPDTMAHAAALLHYVVTGEPEVHELDIGFMKILLGVDLETSIAVAGGLVTESQRTEADGLLSAIIDHWKILKNTSIHGLRRSFLQRSGWLRKQGGSTRLHVQSESFDMLLNSLPWGLSIVKLPWMAAPLHVEWAAS